MRRVQHLERHLTTCKERIKHVFRRSLYQLRETLIDKIDSFCIPHSDYQKFFRNTTIFDFESVCEQEDKFRNTQTTTVIGHHVPKSVSILTNLIEQQIFSNTSSPAALVESLADAFDGLATQSKAQKKLNLMDIATIVKSKLNQTFYTVNRGHCHKAPGLEIEDQCIEEEEEEEEGEEEEEEQDVLTQFLQTQKSQLIDFQDHLERHWNVLLVFGFNSAKYNINLIKR